MMSITAALRQHTLRLTLFTRERCGLCTIAKDVLARVWERKHFEYREVDVMAAGQKKYHDLYAFDVPVVHIDKTATLDLDDPDAASGRQTLMHRFSEADLERTMQQVEEA